MFPTMPHCLPGLPHRNPPPHCVCLICTSCRLCSSYFYSLPFPLFFNSDEKEEEEEKHLTRRVGEVHWNEAESLPTPSPKLISRQRLLPRPPNCMNISSVLEKWVAGRDNENRRQGEGEKGGGPSIPVLALAVWALNRCTSSCLILPISTVKDHNHVC